MSEIECEEKNLVKIKNGTLPVLLTYPHNGTKQPNGSLERSDTNLPDGCAKCQFKIDLDEHTSHITDGVAKRIFVLANEWPYMVKFNYPLLVSRVCFPILPRIQDTSLRFCTQAF
jgi:N-formylglutamate amidohydrolase